jgi:hypothetical protein
MDGISLEVMDHIEEMQKKMNMMQEQMRRNMELMVKSKNSTQASFINSDEPSIFCFLFFVFCFFDFQSNDLRGN